LATKINPPKDGRMESIKATIWKNETEASTRNNVTFSRIYQEGGELELQAQDAGNPITWFRAETAGPIEIPESRWVPPRGHLPHGPQSGRPPGLT
jgi:hypothetical protein